MPRAKVIKIKNKVLEENVGNIDELMKNAFCLNRDDSPVHNADLILTKYKKYKKLIYEFVLIFISLTNKIKDESILAQSRRISKYFNDQRNLLFTLNEDTYDKTLEINSLDQNVLRVLKYKYLDIRDSDILKSILIIGKDINNLKIKKDSYTDVCNAANKGCATLNLFDSIELQNIDKNFNIMNIFAGGSESAKYDDAEKVAIFDNIIEIKILAKRTYRLLIEPDIEIDVLFEKIMGVMDTFTGDLRGCTNGINIIKRSSDLFKKNYKKYYRSATETGDFTNVFSDFVGDIVQTKSEEIKPNTMIELKKVIQKLKQMINAKINQTGMRPPKIAERILETTNNFIDSYELSMTNNDKVSQDELLERQKEFMNEFMNLSFNPK